MNEKAKELCRLLHNYGGRPYFVGGCVRDQFIGVKSKDIDIEVCGLDMDEIKSIITSNSSFKINEVGQSFSVLKVDDMDVSLPRREISTGPGHKDFNIVPDPYMTTKEAALRRDFTINSISIEGWTGNIIDHFDGQSDLNNGVLRACSEQFKEDPLRVLRGMQFISRGFVNRIDDVTLQYCRELAGQFNTLSKERVYGEFVKLFTKGANWGDAIRFLQSSNWLECFPDLWHMNVGIINPWDESDSFGPRQRVGHLQEHNCHPEGNVFEHTCYCLDEAGLIASRENLDSQQSEILGWATLLHDIAKPNTYEINEDGRICNHGHDKVGAPMAEQFLRELKAPNVMIEQVPPLVAEHMFHIPFFKNPNQLTIRVVKRLMLRLYPACPKLLVLLCEADHSGRPPLERGSPASPIFPLLDQIKDEVKPILMGRHLIDIGMRPGPQFGELIKESLDVQIDEDWESVEDAIRWVMKRKDEIK